MPPDNAISENIYIAEDGTISLEESAYAAMHQMIYPQTLPAATIKSVWIPKSFLSPKIIQKSVKSKNMGKKILPGDIRAINDVLMRAYLHYEGETDPTEKQLKDAESIVEHLESVNQTGLLDEIIEELKTAHSQHNLKEFSDILEFSSPFEVGDTVQNETWYNFKGPLSEINSLYD